MFLGIKKKITVGLKGGVTTAYVTGDRTAAITVTASSSLLGGGTADNLVDGSVLNDASGAVFFASGANLTTDRLIFDFGNGNSKRITEAVWSQGSATTHGEWQWFGSNDALTNNAPIGNQFTLGGTSQTQTQLNGNLRSYRAYILQGVSGSKSAGPWITEVEFKQSA